MATDYKHLSVLLPETLDALAIRDDGIYVDATYGRGGHSAAILQALGSEGHLLAMDRDPQAVSDANKRFAGDDRFSIEARPFSMLEQTIGEYGWKGKVNGVLFDLGVSSPQLEDPDRGFSFRQDGPLDMRMDTTQGMTAEQWLNDAGEKEIADVIYRYGEERFSRRIARAIVRARTSEPISRTAKLAAIVSAAIPKREPGKDPATRTFQAIRIHINKELQEIESALPQVLNVLAPGGRLACISFHSLEDRLVKRFMRDQARGDNYPVDLPVTHDMLDPKLRLLGPAVRPGAEEVESNPRARSASLRVAERVGVIDAA